MPWSRSVEYLVFNSIYLKKSGHSNGINRVLKAGLNKKNSPKRRLARFSPLDGTVFTSKSSYEKCHGQIKECHVEKNWLYNMHNSVTTNKIAKSRGEHQKKLKIEFLVLNPIHKKKSGPSNWRKPSTAPFGWIPCVQLGLQHTVWLNSLCSTRSSVLGLSR